MVPDLLCSAQPCSHESRSHRLPPRSRCLPATPSIAHHSANAEFDTQKEMTITGVLMKLEVVNPHSWWHLEVKGADGKVTPWRLESNSPAGLIRLGVKVKTEVKVGEDLQLQDLAGLERSRRREARMDAGLHDQRQGYVLTELSSLLRRSSGVREAGARRCRPTGDRRRCRPAVVSRTSASARAC